MSVVRWEDPPPHGNTGKRRSMKYQDAAVALRAEPGRWAVVAEDIPTGSAGALSSRIRSGLRAPWAPGGSFEARSVGPLGGKSTVYARYMGGAS